MKIIQFRRIFFTGITAGIILGAEDGVSAPVPTGAQLKIDFAFRDNNNQLRNKLSGGCCPYKTLEDNYKETVWIEGPFNPLTPCQIVNYQRTDASIKLVKVITFFDNGQNRMETAVVPNPWSYGDYATPDFLAALIRAGMYYYCTDVSTFTIEGDACSPSLLVKGSPDAQRQNPTTGGYYALPTTGRTEISQTWAGCNGYCKTKNGDISSIPDGVSGASRYPALGTGSVSLTWDMKDYNGITVQEGLYVVWVQMSSHRSDYGLEWGKIVNGKDVIGIETCWDNPAYNNVGNHRVVESFYFSDSGFSKTVYQEKKWSGDTYNYLGSAGMKFTYTSPADIETSPQAMRRSSLTLHPNPVRRNGQLQIELSGRPEVVFSEASLYSLRGALVKQLMVANDGTVQLSGTDNKGQPLSAGLYLLRTTAGENRLAKAILVTP